MSFREVFMMGLREFSGPLLSASPPMLTTAADRSRISRRVPVASEAARSLGFPRGVGFRVQGFLGVLHDRFGFRFA